MRVLFMGRKQPSADLLSWIATQDKVEIVGVLTDDHLDGSPTAIVARDLELRLLRIEGAQSLVADGELHFDLGLSFVYWRILKDPLLTHPEFGIINFHPAPLPDLKGTGGYNIAILEGRDTYGVTAHYVDQGVDTGRIIERRDFKIDPDRETAQSLEKKSMQKMFSLAQHVFSNALDTGIVPSSTNDGGTYISRPEMEALKLIQLGDDVQRKARAFWFPPYPGAQIQTHDGLATVVPDQVLSELGVGATSLFNEPSGR